MMCACFNILTLSRSAFLETEHENNLTCARLNLMWKEVRFNSFHAMNKAFSVKRG